MMPRAANFGCADVEHFVDAYLDGEFTEEARGELEGHIAGCPACAKTVRFHAVWKAGLKAAAPRPTASRELRARLATSLKREPVVLVGVRKQAIRLVPAAAAAVVLVGLAVSMQHGSTVADAAIATYHADPPMDVTGEVEVVNSYLRQRMPFAIRLPHIAGALLIGARVTNIQEHQAVYLRYLVRGNPMTVLVFDPTSVPIEAPHRRYVGTREIYFGGDRGYHVAMVRDRGMGYAFTTDLDEDQMLQLVSSAITH